MPAAGMSFVQLEGNYVISFRDMNEALPAFTAVKLDRRRGSWDGGSIHGSMTNLAAAGAGPRRGSVGVFGSTSALTAGGGGGGSSPGGGSLSGSRLALGDDLAAAGAGGRRKSSVAATPYKLVLTGVPRSVREDAIRAQLDAVIPGIERVYRDPDMARNLSHPPVFLETRSVLAPDAFMLRAEWVPAVQRLVKQANAPAASEDEGIGLSLRASATASSSNSALDEAAREEERRRREALVDTLVTCPHGRYRGQATCPQCRSSARRNTMVSDDIVGHNIFGDGVAPWRPVHPTIMEQSHSSEAAPPPPPKKSSSACSSCLACLRRLVPGMKRRPVRDDDDDDHVDGQQPQGQTPQVRVHTEHHFQQVQEKRVTVSATESNVLDSNFLNAIKSQRRLSAYDDVPAIKVDDVDFKQCNNALL